MKTYQFHINLETKVYLYNTFVQKNNYLELI